MTTHAMSWRYVVTTFMVVGVLAAACSQSAPTGDSGGDASAVTVAVDGEPIPFDHRLLGTNVPAWISPDQLADESFRRAITDLGTTVLRMPGGSWSSEYEWLACENQEGCHWDWAARPSDFAALLEATGTEGMWTVSFNGTAEEAAALVAFFNGSVGDDTLIGFDNRQRDWGTVGQWAELRAEHGHPDPVRIGLWEVGNEVYGARPESAGSECASYGWEIVWTCDGTEYVEGNVEHDGFREFRAAMQKVDPTILVGVVGIGGDQGGWNGFGDEVIERSANALDFYTVHDYGFDSAAPMDEVLSRPSDSWPDSLDDAREALLAANLGVEVPIAVTEYNLVAGSDGDTEGMMAEAVNAFYLADTIGQMAQNGVSMANQWNLVNGETESGSDYGMIDPESGEPNPSFFALALWSRFGDQLVPTAVGSDLGPALRAYGGRAEDGTVTLMVLNPDAAIVDAPVRLDGVDEVMSGRADVVEATGLDARDVTYNGAPGTATDLTATEGSEVVTSDDGKFTITLPPYSITLVSLDPA